MPAAADNSDPPPSEPSMSEPSISVTVPSYNRSASLAELLAAIVAQLHDGDELIVVDDASRDDSAQQARSFERCKVIVHETNQGMVKAWNACLHAASRDWICIIHNDDRIAPGALAAIRHAARLAPRAGLIAHRHMLLASSPVGGSTIPPCAMDCFDPQRIDVRCRSGSELVLGVCVSARRCR